MQMAGQRVGSVEPPRRRQAAGAAVERRELVAAVDHHRHTEGLQTLEGQPDVENALDARRDDRNRGHRQFGEIGGDIEAGRGAAVHAADAAGGEDADIGESCNAHRGRDRRRAGEAGGHQPRQIARCRFVDAGFLRQPLELQGVEANAAHAVQHSDGRGRRPVLAHNRLNLGGEFDVLGVGHAVADDRAFQRDHWRAPIERGRYFLAD